MATFDINIHYLPVPKRLHYLIAHVYFRTKREGCNETNLCIASHFEEDGISESTVEKDLRQCISLGVIEVENPRSPGKRSLKTTQKVHSFLEENTQSLMDRETARSVFGDRKNLRTYQVNNYGQDHKDLRENTVKNYGHNRNRIETTNINSLKGERESFEKIEIVASGGTEFIKVIQDSGLMGTVKKLIGEAGLDPEKETDSTLRHFGERNNGNRWNSQDEFITRLKGYFENLIHHNRPKPKTETVHRAKAGRMIG
jgi:hypothetical protein